MWKFYIIDHEIGRTGLILQTITEITCTNLEYVTKYINTLGGNHLVFNMNIESPHKFSNFNKIPEFISSWIKTGGDPNKYPTNILRVRKQIEWGNKFI